MLREHVRAHHSGPDTKCHNSLAAFICKVCGDTLSSSDELVLHIVAHCDENTAMRRQPQSGPRKYKRRRKLKHETTTLPVRMNEQFDMPFDGISDSDENMKRKGGKKTKRTNVEEGYQNVLKSFEGSLQTINSIVSNSKTYPAKVKTPKKKLKKEEKKAGGVNMPAVLDLPTVNPPGRPKMIHTQKTRVPVEMGTDGVKKGQKTKTMVTRTPKVMPNEQQPNRVQGIITGGERNRPRTKNVSYHIEGRQQFIPATFSKPKEMGIEGNPPNIEMVNIKVEPGLLKLPLQFTTNNNGDILNLKQEHIEKSDKPSPKKRGPVKKAKKRQSAAMRKPKEKMDVLNPEIPVTNPNTNIHHEVHQSEEMVQEESVQSTQQLFGGVVDGNNLEVSFEANVVSEQEEIVQESILPDLDKEVNHVGDLSTGNVKLSVKVESTPDGILDVHSLIGSVEESVPETIIPDTLEYTCEMCAAVFSTRAELLVHVPIHI